MTYKRKVLMVNSFLVREKNSLKFSDFDVEKINLISYFLKLLWLLILSLTCLIFVFILNNTCLGVKVFINESDILDIQADIRGPGNTLVKLILFHIKI